MGRDEKTEGRDTNIIEVGTCYRLLGSRRGGKQCLLEEAS